MPNAVLDALKRADQLASRAYLTHFEANALLGFYFHGVSPNDRALDPCLGDPRQFTTIQHLRQFVEYYLAQGFTFVAADDIAPGLDSHAKYVAVTFDDGYANNQWVLPLLHEYKIPATFFIATGYVEKNQSFWWDILYRERARRGVSAERIVRETQILKHKTHLEIEGYLKTEFGAEALRPLGEADRPFSVSELRALAQDPYVCLGNHTRDHAILINYASAEIESQIAECQKFLHGISGRAPTAISYPSGRFARHVAQAARRAGLKLGFTVAPRKNRLPLDSEERLMQLARFHLSRRKDVRAQSEMFRSDILLYPRLRYLWQGPDEEAGISMSE